MEASCGACEAQAADPAAISAARLINSLRRLFTGGRAVSHAGRMADAGQKKLLGERTWSHLELHNLRQRPLAAFDMPRCIGRVVRPQTFALPTDIGVVDATVRRPYEVRQRVRHAERH